MSQILKGDCLERMKDLEENSIDTIITDPPYGYSFMGKKWDVDVPSAEVFAQMFRVLKDGAFLFCMSAPRLDCQTSMAKNIQEGGFDIHFTPIYWTYASGFPKAQNLSKAIDKKLGVKAEEIEYEHPGRKGRSYQTNSNVFSGDRKDDKLHKDVISFGNCSEPTGFKRDYYDKMKIQLPTSPEAQTYKDMYGGFQPKPAVEVIIVAQKPNSETTNIDQVLLNGKGGTYLGRGRIPADYTSMLKLAKSAPFACVKEDSGNVTSIMQGKSQQKHYADWKDNQKKIMKKIIGGRHENKLGWQGESGYKIRVPKHRGGGIHVDATNPEKNQGWNDPNSDYCGENSFQDIDLRGRFPANLLISDNILCEKLNECFSLDEWYEAQLNLLSSEDRANFPFLYVPKPTKKEKNKGLNNIPEGQTKGGGGMNNKKLGGAFGSIKAVQSNIHPTVKPLKLFEYLIAISPTKPGDIILDPYGGSGTTAIACKLADRKFVIMERNPEYFEIMKARIQAYRTQKSLFSFL